MAQTVVVTGASRGIGLELARQYAARGDRVLATARKPAAAAELAALGPNVSRHPLDVTDDDAIRRFASEIVDVPVDVLIHNAGIGGSGKRLPEADLSNAMEVLKTNAVAPLLLTQALLPNLRAGRGKKLVHITSRMGSFGDHPAGGHYAYRMSKAALNMASVLCAIDLRADGIVSVVPTETCLPSRAG